MKKSLWLLFSSFLFAGHIQYALAQPDIWVQKNATGSTSTTGNPATGRYAGICFTIGNKAYIGGGLNLSSGLVYPQDFWEYDAPTDTWTRKADIPVKRQHAVSFSIANKGYFGTGFDGNSDKKDFWEYDPSTDTWVQKGDFAGAARQLATGFSIGNKGYLGTGEETGTPRKDFWEYDPLTDTWIQKADFGGGTRKFAVGFGVNNKGYIGIGYNVIINIRKDFWEYDPIANSWTQKADYGGGPSYACVGFGLSGKGYVGTGHNGTNYKKDFWEYDPIANSWTQKTDFGGTERLDAAGFSADGKAYIGSGHDLNEIDRNDLWVFTTVPVVVNPPTITSVSPGSACAGEMISITGTNFNDVISVTIGGTSVAYTVVSPTLITTVATNGATGVVNVITDDGTANYNGFILLTPAASVSFDPDTIILNSPGSVTLNPVITGTPGSFVWSPANKLVDASSLNPQTIIIADLASFVLTLTGPEGCPVSGKITILISKELYLPAAFTPNGDGLNDLFRVPPGVIMELKELSVYDRWGNKIFSTNNISQGWDGTYRGTKSVSGIYVYTLYGKKNNKEIMLKGTFILIR